MPDASLRIDGTPYLRRVNGVLRRALRVRLPVPFCGLASTHVTAEDDTVASEVAVADGQVLLDGPATLDRPLNIAVRLTCAAGSWAGTAQLAPTRPWTIYITQDKHLDFGWIHPVEKVIERMNVLLDYHLDASRRMGLRWNLESSVWVEEYLRARPSARREQLLAALRSGRFEVSANWLVPLPGYMGAEEHLRSLYYARALQDELGIPVRTVCLQEAPSLSWGLATILAGAGFTHVVKGAYGLRNPHLAARDPLPLAHWEGPDGSRVLLRWSVYEDTHSWGGYGEAYKLWIAPSDRERTQFIEETIARYEGYAAHPVDAILLAGTGFDRYPQTTAVTDFVHAFNAQGWAYPRLVDATWNDYWQDVEGQVAARQLRVPVQKGDWGTAWEEWPAQMAHLNTIYRRARETVLAAQTWTALTRHLDAASHPARQEALANAWRAALQFTEHDFGGISPVMAADTYDRKAQYAYTALREGTRALEGGLTTLAASIPRPASAERALLVANSCSWARSGLVEVVVPDVGPYAVQDLLTGQPVPAQIDTRGAWPEQYLSFVAPDVPAFGYRTFSLSRGAGSTELPKPVSAPVIAAAAPSLESDHYRLALDPETGGLRSLVDVATQRELVAPSGDYALNAYLHLSDGVLHPPHATSIVTRQGPLGCELIVEIVALRAKLRTTYRLYHALPQLDIIHELVKEPSAEPQCSWFAFPLNLPACQYHYDGPAAILRPGLLAEGGDLLPGAALSSVAVQSFLAASGPDFSITLATPDAHLVQFGAQVLRNPMADSAPSDPLALSLVLHNLTRNDHVLAQGGQSHFAFRYSLRSAPGPFCAEAAVRFAKSVAQPLAATWVLGDAAVMPAAYHAFLAVEPGHVVATGLKVAEDGRGWVLRLWECTGRPTAAVVDVGALPATRAWRCDLLERTQEPLPIQDGKVRLDMPARSLRALRFV